jgi:hypothetical protein
VERWSAVTSSDDFPDEIHRLIEDLEGDGFDIAYGSVEPLGTPGFNAKREEEVVQVADHKQVWFVTLVGDEGRVDESYDRPARVRREVDGWLDAGGQS